MKLTKLDRVFVPVTSPLDKADTFYSVHNGDNFKDWVQKQNNKYLLDEEEIIKLISDTWVAARYRGINSFTTSQQYINSILNK